MKLTRKSISPQLSQHAPCAAVQRETGSQNHREARKPLYLKKKSINKSDKKLHGNSPVEWSKEWTGTGEMDQHIQALAVLPENQGSTPHMAAYHLL